MDDLSTLRYSSNGFVLLGMMLSAVTGKAGVIYFIKFRSISHLCFTRELCWIAVLLGGKTAIYHRRLGVWHPQQSGRN
jgi:hypothetical protein